MRQADDGEDKTPEKEEILERVQSAYEAVVAIAKEARRLNAAPGIYLASEEKPIHKAVKNFVDGKVDYEVGNDQPAGRRSSGKGKK